LLSPLSPVDILLTSAIWRQRPGCRRRACKYGGRVSGSCSPTQEPLFSAICRGVWH